MYFSFSINENIASSVIIILYHNIGCSSLCREQSAAVTTLPPINSHSDDFRWIGRCFGSATGRLHIIYILYFYTNIIIS